MDPLVGIGGIFPPGTIAAFGLVALRTGALFVSAPILGTGSAFTGYRVALVLAVSFVLHTSLGAPHLVDVTPMAYGAMALRELLIGLAMAFVLVLLQLAARMGGDLIGHEMGLAMANQTDPVTGVQTPLVARVYDVLFVLGFLAVDGHHVLLRALRDSFGRAPVGDLRLELGTLELVERFFAETFAAGVTFAAPIMVTLFMLSVLIGVLSRVVPQINVLEMGFTLRVGLALSALFLFAPLLAPSLMHIYDLQSLWLGELLDALGPAPEVLHG